MGLNSQLDKSRQEEDSLYDHAIEMKHINAQLNRELTYERKKNKCMAFLVNNLH